MKQKRVECRADGHEQLLSVEQTVEQNEKTWEFGMKFDWGACRTEPVTTDCKLSQLI